MSNVIHAKFGSGGGDGIVTALEELLERARAGEITGVAVIALTTDNGVMTGWSGDCPTCVTLGAIKFLEVDFINARMDQ